jgi:hypothetical protein
MSDKIHTPIDLHGMMFLPGCFSSELSDEVASVSFALFFVAFFFFFLFDSALSIKMNN